MHEHPLGPRGIVGCTIGIEEVEECSRAAREPHIANPPQLPCAGRSDRHPAGTGPAHLAPDKEQPGPEYCSRVRALDVFEEGGVDRTGGIVEGEEHDATARPDGRGLRGHLHSGDEHLLP